jgi:hypothetical protein
MIAGSGTETPRRTAAMDRAKLGGDDQVEPFLEAAEAFLAELRDDPTPYLEQRVTPNLEQASEAAARYGLRCCTP